MEPIEKRAYRGQVITIFQDEEPVHPRKDCDPLGTLVTFHRRYNLGEKHEFETPNDFQKFIRSQKKAVVLPVYLYDHSGLRVRTSSFAGRAQHADWDSGQVGWIYLTREQIRKQYGLNPPSDTKLRKYLDNEIKTLDQYLSGDVYGYVISMPKADDENSCFGFYGMECCIQEAQQVIDYILDEKPIRDEIRSMEKMEAIFEGRPHASI